MIRLVPHPPQRLAVESFKVCPLCGALNALEQRECFVCRWSGEFVHDVGRVERALENLVFECPKLVAALEKPSRVQRWWRKVTRFMRRRVDFRG